MNVELDPLVSAIGGLTPRQREQVGRLVAALTVPVLTDAEPGSDIASTEFIDLMADILRGHHASSTKPLGKEPFEHALAAVLVALSRSAELSPMGFPGADMTVDGTPWSLKTQADRSIRPGFIHISKMMELGKGRWNDESDLAALRDRMLDHMEGYDRIFSMRYLSGAATRVGRGEHEYELVEIPKALLQLSADAPCVMHHDSKQSPKPGSCRVDDADGTPMFELYFDGGTERKLQIRKLRTDLCIVHARWRFVDPARGTTAAGH